MDYKQYEELCKLESKRHGWGIILIARNQLRNYILKFKPRRFLDIGCHNRHLEKTVKEWFPEVETFGVDVVVYDVKPTCVCDGALLPFKSNFFDFITIIETLEHIPDYVSCLRECYRVLRKDGILFIQSVSCLSRHAFEGDETHFHVLHPNCLERLCRLIGFKCLEKGMINLTFYMVLQK